MEETFQEFRDLVGKISDVNAASALLAWDMQTYMPPKGGAARSRQLATLNKMAHELLVSDQFGELLEKARQATDGLDPDSDETRLVRRITREYEKQQKVPSDWIGEFSQLTALAQQTWEQARKESDFSSFEPHLVRIVEMRREYADFFTPYEHIYDPLLDDYEPGMLTSQVVEVFSDLLPQQVELLQAIVDRGSPVDDSILKQSFGAQEQWDFGIELAKQLGYDFDRGRQDKSAHPFTTSFSIDDVRITTRIMEDQFASGFFATLHETGHALYEQGSSRTLERTPLTGGASMAIHESQSRLYENLVGRGRHFMKSYYPRLQAMFSQQLGNVDQESFYRAINKVEASLIRVEADEATYNLHVMLRLDLEIALIEGSLQVSDLPQAWNEKMEEFLGLAPPDDSQGVLQDVHWSAGLFGYFPTYAIGNLIASQFWEQIEADIPDLPTQLEAGNLGELHAWLLENIHQHGGKFEPLELVERVTGSGIESEPYMRYLRQKFGDIYSL